MNQKETELLNIKNRLVVEFGSLMDSFAHHEGDGICISDIEFALTEFKGTICELEDKMSE